jgi:voltage-gated potassium channel
MARTTKQKLYDVIFEADTSAGKFFDIVLFVSILLSIVLVLFESVESINTQYGHLIKIVEWFITGLFTIEYIARIYVVKKPIKYIWSFFGVIDLLALLPNYIALFLTGVGGLAVIRGLRLVRIFRIFKLSRYINEGSVLIKALVDSRHKLSVFLVSILTIVTIIGAVMYIVEGPENGFKSIPESIYWAIVTITTVGYGDIAPHTDLGKFISSFLMIVGYAIIAVPTGIVGAELNKKTKVTTQVCPNCLREGHDYDAKFCKYCGSELN